jgi:hypothetical protein
VGLYRSPTIKAGIARCAVPVAERSASKGTRIKMGRHSAWTPKHLAVRPIARRPCSPKRSRERRTAQRSLRTATSPYLQIDSPLPLLRALRPAMCYK